MKKFFAMLLAVSVVILSLCACESKKEFVFTTDYLKAVDGNNEIVVTENTHLEISDGKISVRSFGSEEMAVSEGNYEIAGVGLGDTYETFVDAFGLEKGKAMWETLLYVNERENVFNYPAFEKKAINFEDYDDVFLTVGFYTDKDGKWNTFDASTLKAAWNLETDEKQREKIFDFCIISAGLDENGVINGLFLDYGSYGSFEELENYEINVDFFPEDVIVEEQQPIEAEQLPETEQVPENVTEEAETPEVQAQEVQTEEAQTQDVQPHEVQAEEQTAAEE